MMGIREKQESRMNETESKIAMIQTRRDDLRRDLQGAEWAERQMIGREIKMADKALKYLRSL